MSIGDKLATALFTLIVTVPIAATGWAIVLAYKEHRILSAANAVAMVGYCTELTAEECVSALAPPIVHGE